MFFVFRLVKDRSDAAQHLLGLAQLGGLRRKLDLQVGHRVLIKKNALRLHELDCDCQHTVFNEQMVVKIQGVLQVPDIRQAF